MPTQPTKQSKGLHPAGKKSAWSQLLASTALDTITTRFLLVFLFLLAIPLMTVILFTLSQLNEQMRDNTQAQLRLTVESFQNSLPVSASSNSGYVYQGGKLYFVGGKTPFVLDEQFLNRYFEQMPSALGEIWLVNENTVRTATLNPSIRSGMHPLSSDETRQILSRLSKIVTKHPVEITLSSDQKYWLLQTVLFSPTHQKTARLVFIQPSENLRSIKIYYNGMYVTAMVSVILVVILAMFAGRPITQPLIKLIQQVNAINHDNLLNEQINVQGVYEINQLSKAFNQMLLRLKQEHRLRDEFVATLTHDLKVPMLAEKQTLTYLLKGTYGELNASQQEVIDVIRSTNASSLSLVNGLLEIYRYESGTVALKLTEWDMRHLMLETINELKFLAEEKSITLSLTTQLKETDSAMVYADLMEIKRTLNNLISNAITNTPKGGSVSCRVETEASFDADLLYGVSSFEHSTLRYPPIFTNRVLVSIQDSGVGFSSEDLPNLFRQFSASRGRNPMSTGLGLYNCYQVIQAHHGMLWVETTEGEGSAVSFVIPQNEKTYQDRRREDRRSLAYQKGTLQKDSMP